MTITTPPRCTCGDLKGCKTCYQRDWRRRNPEKVRAAKARWGVTRDRSGDPKSIEYSRRYYRENVAQTLASTQARHAEDPRKRIARNAVNGAVRDGKLTRDPCAVCGKVRTHGHHDDYDKPLEVIWLCPKHHADRHREMGG